jgi:MFS family permease
MDVRPGRSLGLLSAAHAVNHAFAVLLPLIFLAIIDEFGVTVQSVAFLAAFGSLASGVVQLSYAELTRHVSRKRLLTAGGLLFGGGFAAMSLATSFITFAIPNVAARIGGSPQHPVGNGLLAEQYTPERRGFAISAHIAGGNMGTVLIAIIGTPLIALIGWRGVSVVFGVAAAAIALLILALVRESGTDRAAARAGGSSLDGLKRVLGDRDMRWVFLTSVLGGGGRGLGVVNLFALIYMTRVLGLDEGTSGAMYGALIIFSVPMPLLAGWLWPKAADHRGVPRGCHRIRHLHLRRVVADLAVGRHRGDGSVLVRRVAAAPGAPRRHVATREPRRRRVRRRIAVDRGVWDRHRATR